MALADTARLVASLELQDKGFSKTADMAGRKLDGLSGRVGKIGSIGKQGLSNLGRNLGRIGIGLGAIGAVAVTASIKSGIDSLVTLENATSQVDGAIKQLGLTGRISASQIAQWADEIETATDAAFDDKDILAASENLIRFGNIAPAALRETLVVATDLAALMGGDVNAASLKMSKALANPLKATRLLTQAGVHLDKAEQKRLDNLVESGKLHKAQALLIDLVREKTDGAAKGLNGPVADAQNRFNEAMEKANQAIATGFLPLMTDVADFLSEELGKESTISAIKEIGGSLADAGRAAFDFIKKIPWDAVKDGLGAAATFAGKLFDAFRSMPPEVQATLIALAGLDKLSGGAISGIVGELGKGLIKGVLGITAGVVNVRGAVVNGGGGGGGTGVVPTGEGGGKVSRLGKLFDFASKIAIVGIVASFAEEVSEGLEGVATDLRKAIDVDGFWKNLGITDLPIPTTWPWGPDNTPTIMPDVFGGNGLLGGNAPVTKGVMEHIKGTTEAVETQGSEDRAVIGTLTTTTDQGLQNTTRAAALAGVASSSATRTGSAGIVAAIGHIPAPVVNVSQVVNVTPAGIEKSTTTQTSNGNGNGSAGGGRNERRPE